MSGSEESAAPIVQYWHAAEVPPPIAELLATFPERTPGLPHLVFDREAAERLIEERQGPRQASAFRACAVPAMQADYFRYCAVHALGGVYADANFAAQRDLGPLLDDGGNLFEFPPHGPVLNGLFAFRSAGHPLLEMAIEVATANVEKQLSPAAGLTTGPAIFTGLVRLARGGSLEDWRLPVGPGMRPYAEACIDGLVESLRGAVERHGPAERALEGVTISPYEEMLSFASKPDLRGARERIQDRHWSTWEGPIFRPADSGTAAGRPADSGTAGAG